MTLGCLTILRIWISRVTLSTSDWSLILSFYSILIATFSPVIRCVPSLTLPKVPWPKDFPIKHTNISISFQIEYLLTDKWIALSINSILLLLQNLYILAFFLIEYNAKDTYRQHSDQWSYWHLDLGSEALTELFLRLKGLGFDLWQPELRLHLRN